MIVGIDEVGRGPWAGPLVVAAVVLPDNCTIDGLTDSKKLTKKRREALDPLIRETALGYGLGWVHADELDEIGLSESLRLATRRAIEQITIPYHEIIIDGTINFLHGTRKGEFVTTLPKADLLIPAVSAASVIAKVARDTFMSHQDQTFPGYNFASHAGYGTAAHRSAIEQFGVTPLHRLSFAPLSAYKDAVMSAVSTVKNSGAIAEDVTARYLQANGHVIVERNWKTRRCEIDIISTKDSVYYFTEVKYRKNRQYGSSMDALTDTKIRQMTFAASCYIAAQNIQAEPRLAWAGVDGTTDIIWQSVDY